MVPSEDTHRDRHFEAPCFPWRVWVRQRCRGTLHREDFLLGKISHLINRAASRFNTATSILRCSLPESELAALRTQGVQYLVNVSRLLKEKPIFSTASNHFPSA